MNRSPTRRMVDRGRKAGIGTTELYQALASRPHAVGDMTPGQTDCNGFVVHIDANGQRTYVAPAPRA